MFRSAAARMSSSVAARKMRMAISPRFAAMSFLICRRGASASARAPRGAARKVARGSIACLAV